jgi:HEAT repeat protein
MNKEENSNIYSKIDSLIKGLHNKDGLKRQRARFGLIHIGHEAVPSLIDVIQNEEGQERWEAIETLSGMDAPSAVPVLVDALKDDDKSIRWAASKALIAQDRACLKPLFQALVKESGFGSSQFRHGAHHILHVLNDRYRLLPNEIKVFKALEGSQPEAKAPWAAETALEDLEFNRRSP